MCELMFP